MTLGAVYLGLDMGTTSAKCLAVDAGGAVLAQAQQAYPMRHPHQGWAEQDPDDYWRVLLQIVADCVEQCGVQGHAPPNVAALAMSTQGDTLVVADAGGGAHAPAMSWMDVRAQDEYAELLAEADQRFWYRETGIRLVPSSSAASIRQVQYLLQWMFGSLPRNSSRSCFSAAYITLVGCSRRRISPLAMVTCGRNMAATSMSPGKFSR
jgi:sugar (pentulose or hexulose) kinase